MSTHRRQSSSGTQYGPSPSTAVTSPTGSATVAARTLATDIHPFPLSPVGAPPPYPRCAPDGKPATALGARNVPISNISERLLRPASEPQVTGHLRRAKCGYGRV